MTPQGIPRWISVDRFSEALLNYGQLTMSPKRLKPCCKRSQAQGLTYCPTCHTSLWPDEATLVSKPSQPKPVITSPIPSDTRTNVHEKNSNRSVIFGMVMACLAVFAAVVAADYYVQLRAARDAIASARATPTAAGSPKQTPSASPTLNPLSDIVTETATPKPKAKPTATDIEKYFDSPTPTPIAPPQTPKPRPTIDLSAGVLHRVTLVTDYAMVDRGAERRYRFNVRQGGTSTVGSFKTQGNAGDVVVTIICNGSTYYRSNASFESIEVRLPGGPCDLIIANRGNRIWESVQVNLYGWQ